MLRVGIVGCGSIFTMHATSVDHLENATLVGVCDIKKDRADAAAEKYNVPVYYDYKELIDKGNLDVVHVCVPHYMHPVISRYALEQGVNVLCEKPMSIDYESSRFTVCPLWPLGNSPILSFRAIIGANRIIAQTNMLVK